MNKDNLPKHIAIIMDGNGRWASKRGLPRNMGHRKGAETLGKIIRYANKLKISHLTVFAFSTENWQRPADEVKFLMSLPFEFLDRFNKNYKKDNIKINVIGSRNRLSKELANKISEVENNTKDATGLNFIIALNYGSQDEIIDGINSIIASKEEINKENFRKHLYTKDIPDVDLLIRTSGEYRISNFLLWQIAYSELYFTDTFWPDFNEKSLDEALKDYTGRERRFGGLK
jgi:undecaprenyl diphosphate synthase